MGEGLLGGLGRTVRRPGTLAYVRVLIAPDKFAGTLTAVEAAEAMAAGWRRGAPDDKLELAPLSDGGPGFVDVVQAAKGGELLSVTVTGPLGDPTPATLLVTGDTAYVECAQAAGLHLVPPEQRRPAEATTYGVGELVRAAAERGARRVVVGLGGSATNDGGAGLLAALGAQPAEALRRGGGVLADLTAVDLTPAREAVAGLELVAASDVDNPLLGPRGAIAVFGPQKGVRPEQVPTLDAALQHWAELTDARQAKAKGAGAAGGLGFGLLLLGAERVPGIATIMDLVGLAARAGEVDVVVTGEGSFDWQSLQGKVVSGVARVAAEQARPCVVLAGRVEVGRREIAAAGVESAYAVADVAGSAQAAMARPAEYLADLAERVARTWSRRR